MSDTEQTPGAEGAEKPQGAQGTAPPAAAPAELTNAELKAHPWVSKLKQDSAELHQLKQSMADAESRAEREKAEAAEDWKKALDLEKTAREDVESRYQKELKQIRLDAEFTKAGLVDPRAIQLFEADFDPDKQSASEFVASIKAGEHNAMYFDQGRQKQTPPRVTNGPPDTFEPERDLDKWLRSTDPLKRERAIAYNRKMYERSLNKG